MAKTFDVDGEALVMAVRIKDVLIRAASHMIEQNYMLICRDLARAKAESVDGEGELPIAITFKTKALASGQKIVIDPVIEWKRTIKNGDEMDTLYIDPSQPDLPFDGKDGEG